MRIKHSKTYPYELLITGCIIILFGISCSNKRDYEYIEKKLSSPYTHDVIKGLKCIEKDKDKKYLTLLMKGIYDYRRSTNINSYHKRIYYLKMQLIVDILNKEPPYKITNDPNKDIVWYYYNKLLQMGYNINQDELIPEVYKEQEEIYKMLQNELGVIDTLP